MDKEIGREGRRREGRKGERGMNERGLNGRGREEEKKDGHGEEKRDGRQCQNLVNRIFLTLSLRNRCMYEFTNTASS